MNQIKTKKYYFSILIVLSVLIHIFCFSKYFNNQSVKGVNTTKIYKALRIPNDQFFTSQWALKSISAEKGWDQSIGSTDTVIAILDTGVSLNHPDLETKIVAGFDFVEGDNDPSPKPGGGEAAYHGTLVAGAAAGSTNNTLGISGVCWSCKIMPVKVLDENGEGTSDKIALGIKYAVDHGAKVINMSFGYSHEYGPDSLLTDAINYAYERDVIMVAASGNDGGGVNYPAAYDKVIAVGAIDSSGLKTGWSSSGPELDLVAPGVSILTTYTYWDGTRYLNAYANSSGTSLSAPLVSGAIATVSSGLSGQDARNILTTSAVCENICKTGGVSSYGSGSLNIAKFTKEPEINNLTFSNYWPARGEDFTLSYQLRNNLSTSVTLQNAGVFGRLNGNIADFGWGGPVTLAAGETKTITSTIKLSEVGSFSITPGFIYGDKYYYLTSHTNNLTVRYPDILVAYIPNTNSLNPVVGQPINLSAVIQNKEVRPITFDLLGIYGRLNGSILDVTWLSNYTLAPGEIKVLSGTVTPNMTGTYNTQIGYLAGSRWGYFGDVSRFMIK